LQDLPDNLKVYTEIFMYYPVPQPYNFVPLYLGVAIFEVSRQSIRSFSYNLKVPNYCIYGLVVFLKNIKRHIADILLDFVNCFTNIVQQ